MWAGGGNGRDNTRSRGCREACIQAAVDQNATPTKDPTYTPQKPKASTVEIGIM